MRHRSERVPSADADLVREMLAFAAERLMEFERGAIDPVDRSWRRMRSRRGRGRRRLRAPERLTRRNGCRERGRQTRAGRVDLAVPEPRKGSDLPRVPGPRRTAGTALVALAIGLGPMAPDGSLQKACVQGVSTRSVDDLVRAMGGEEDQVTVRGAASPTNGVSRSQASRLCAEIDERVDAFLSRPLEGGSA